MAGITKTRWAVRLSVQQLVGARSWAYLWTFTTADKIGVPVLADRWNLFRRWFQRAGGRCVRVFEPYPGGHGWHVHFITADRLDITEVRPKAEAAGFGRIHVKRIPAKKAGYIAKYVGKNFGARQRLRGARMWACVGFHGSSAKDIEIERRTLWTHWINDHWEWKPGPPHFNETRWVVGSDRRMRLERIWIYPPWTRELAAEVRRFPLGIWGEESLLRWGFKKTGISTETVGEPCAVSQ
jgi:hypothetical protein